MRLGVSVHQNRWQHFRFLFAIKVRVFNKPFTCHSQQPCMWALWLILPVLWLDMTNVKTLFTNSCIERGNAGDNLYSMCETSQRTNWLSCSFRRSSKSWHNFGRFWKFYQSFGHSHWLCIRGIDIIISSLFLALLWASKIIIHTWKLKVSSIPHFDPIVSKYVRE